MDRDSPMTSALISLLLAGLPLLTGCAQPAAQAGGGGGGTIKAINHTKWAINPAASACPPAGRRV